MAERPGIGVDATGGPVIDPTTNVLNLVEAAIKRQDDLREMQAKHQRDLADLRHAYEHELRESESARIDAIRAVDVGAVSRAADVAAAQAETLRTQVQTTASAAQAALSAALEPIIKDIADLRRAQYEAQGVKAQTGETRLNVAAFIGVAGFIVGVVIALIPVLLR